MSVEQHLSKIIAKIDALPTHLPRKLIAIAGPPASGKSTLAEALLERLNAEVHPKTPRAALLPMDGYHLDNALLEERGLLSRKGAPETFDAFAFCEAVRSLTTVDRELFFPQFDRAQDQSIAQSISISPSVPIVIIEGNYLLMRSQPWASVREDFDLAVFLNPPVETLEKRLEARWLKHGLTLKDARCRVRENDLPNAKAVIEQSGAADLRL